ncbi:reticulon-4-interacting protein 1 homolog, mitochondrial-like isoform X2 [Homarus americanus]|uniref:Reticulon-4-interacting protein 1-like 1 n=2 Tax=Homarus americanus TaxID=6706 RepID=A0A8J5K408_HOMAM|nr:reticulon-4-interacting protein 1 homolog, mitochondrial-like isoform X2 [Homarus americanus]XP_042230362.1 reticulon-4-interacting protein 1 homolog, mitochondrial-like isoform X2 [Homarus americanus]KAG7164484.1 Reticulon-4-interacting protein 1-like 1 [Homarus americanus]
MNLLYPIRRLPTLCENVGAKKSLHKTPSSWRRGFSVSCRKSSLQPEEAEAVGELRMRAWQTTGYDGVDGLLLGSVRVPPILLPRDVLVRVQAASVNPIDTAIINGYGGEVLNMMRTLGRLEQGILDDNQMEFPLTAGRDFAGEVVSVGQDVKSLAVSDRVFGVVSPQRQGSHAEFVTTAASNVCLMPNNINAEEAASVPYAALTAWSAVMVTGMLTPDAAPRSKVLLLGASGGVGTIICQLLSSWGAQVVGLCSSDALDLVTSLGVEALDYREPTTKDMLIAEGGFDLVINATGEDDLDYMKALKPWKGCSYITLSPPLLRNIDSMGLAAGLFKSARQVLCRNATSLSEGRAYKWAFYMPNPWALNQLAKMLASQRIRPVIDKIFPFTEAPEAYRYVIDGHARGKTVLSLSK